MGSDHNSSCVCVLPSRFAPEAVAARNTFSYMPFSAGPHSCIGMRLAQQEIMTVMAVILRSFRFIPCPETQVCAFGLTENLIYTTKGALSAKNFPQNLTGFLAGRSHLDTNHGVIFSMPTSCQSATFVRLFLRLSFVFFTTKNLSKKQMR